MAWLRTSVTLRWMTLSLSLVLAAIAPQGVTSFSVGGSAARRNPGVNGMDLVDALSILQRERRRVGAADFLDSASLLDRRPLTPQDVSDWLRESRDGGMALNEDDLNELFGAVEEPAWVSDGDFKGFSPQALTVKPSKEEIEDIFSDDEETPANENDRDVSTVQDKEKRKVKKKSVVAKQERRLVKKSVSSPLESAAERVGVAGSLPSISSGELSLESLTKEELNALMRAVGKLQKQVEEKSDGSGEMTLVEEVRESEPGAALVQPASKAELKSLFDDDEEDSSDEETMSNGELVVEEEVQTPEGESRVLEVQTPEGGRRVTELDTPDGEENVMTEELPAVDVDNLENALEDSERELTDALASQLEEDISEEAVKEEIAAEVEEEAEKEEEEEAEEAVEAIAQAQSDRQEAEEAVEAAKDEIVRELGAKNLAALEKFWLTQDGGTTNTQFPEKRTTKRAANSYKPGAFDAGRRTSSVRDLDLEQLLSNTNIRDILAEDADNDAFIDQLNKEAEQATLGQDILDEENIKNAMDAISQRGDGEDIIYGSPLTGDEFVDDAEGTNDGYVFDLVPEKPGSSASDNKNKITKERLQELAKTLSLNSADFDDADTSPEENSLLPENIEDEMALVSENNLGVDTEDFDLDSETTLDLPKEVSGLPAPIGQFVTRIVELEDEVSQLRQIAKLADLENDVLTDALNEATMAQQPGTVSDMEFQSLQQAIIVERELQKLKNGVKFGDLNLVVDTGRIGPDNKVKSAPSKKGEPWRRKRGKLAPADVGLGAFPVSTLRRRSGQVSSSKSDMERLLGETYLRKSDKIRLSDLDLEDVPVASIFLPDADMCPAVQKYSSNCELADIYSLPVDYEARALCNLHEMCYSCGYSLNVPQSTCDQVYRTAASTLCRDGQACVLEAEIFLRTMKLKTRYVPHAQPSCRSRCTAAFLGMF